MFMKKTAQIAASLIIAALPFSANAAGLTIDNKTDFDSTSVLNNGACSTILGADGITKAHTKKTVASSRVRLACLGHWSNCKAVVYMTNNCTGPAVATVYFDVNTGIKKDTLVNHSDKFSIDGEGFTATITQKS
jgi:hypothetical protein